MLGFVTLIASMCNFSIIDSIIKLYFKFKIEIMLAVFSCLIDYLSGGTFNSKSSFK